MSIESSAGTPRTEIEAAIIRIEQVIARKPESGHEEVMEAIRQIIQMRDSVLQAARSENLPRGRLDDANAIVSLAFGTMFPLIGVHLHRFEQARDALRSLAGRV